MWGVAVECGRTLCLKNDECSDWINAEWMRRFDVSWVGLSTGRSFGWRRLYDIDAECLVLCSFVQRFISRLVVYI